MLARVISGANPELRPILTLAGEYAEVWVRRQQTSDPKVRAECDAAMSAIRGKLKRVCPLAPAEMPGAALLRNKVEPPAGDTLADPFTAPRSGA